MKEYEYKDLGFLKSVLCTLLFIGLVLTAFAVVSGVWEYQLLKTIQSGGEFTDAQIEQNDSRQGLIGIVQLLLLVITGIVFLRWVYCVSRNAHSINSENLEITPGWAVGYYFIPILNLWKPYSAIKEAYGTFTDDEESTGGTAIIGAWWFFWIVSNILGRVSFRLAMRAESIDELLQSASFMIASDSFDVLLNLVALMLVLTVSHASDARAEEGEFQYDRPEPF